MALGDNKVILYIKVSCRFIVAALAMIIPYETVRVIGPLADKLLWDIYAGLVGPSYFALFLMFGWEPLVDQNFKKNKFNVSSDFRIIFWFKAILSFVTLSFFAIYLPYQDQLFNQNVIILGSIALIVINAVFLLEAYKWVRIYRARLNTTK